MIIECSKCESKVDCKVLSENKFKIETDTPLDEYKLLILECPVCYEPIFARQELTFIEIDRDGDHDWEIDWDSPEILWPNPIKQISKDIPDLVRESLEEAEKCFKGKAYKACAVMCGTALEAICAQFNTKKKVLAGGLKELLDNQIIDKKIYQWSEALRQHRNIGAHATAEKISKEDAFNLLNFSHAICEYIFTLTKKFDDFIKRKEKLKKDEKKTDTPK